MDILRRVLGGGPSAPAQAPPSRRADVADRLTPVPVDGIALAGDQGRLWAVGESHYRDALGGVTGGPHRDGVAVLLTAALVPQRSNAADTNAVAVVIQDKIVAYLSRDDAAAYRGVFDRLGELGLTGYCD